LEIVVGVPWHATMDMNTDAPTPAMLIKRKTNLLAS
jgi:hypothetical protein